MLRNSLWTCCHTLWAPVLLALHLSGTHELLIRLILQWMETPGGTACPVCKAGLSKDKLIPIYGRGGDNRDPRLQDSLLVLTMEERLPLPGQRGREQNNNLLITTSGSNLDLVFTLFIRTSPLVRETFSHSLGFATVTFLVLLSKQPPPYAGMGAHHEPAPSEERQAFARILFSFGLLLLFSILLV